MSSKLANLYNRFIPNERINLTLAALARGDDDEVQRLKKSCPKKQYHQNDAAYADSMAKLIQIVSGFTRLFQFHHSKILASENLLNVAVLSNLTYKALGLLENSIDTNLIPEIDYESLSVNFEQEKQDHIGCLKAVYQALVLFCAKSEINLDTMLKWLELKVWCSNIDFYLDTDVDIDQNYVEAVKTRFLDFWRRE